MPKIFSPKIFSPKIFSPSNTIKETKGEKSWGLYVEQGRVGSWKARARNIFSKNIFTKNIFTFTKNIFIKNIFKKKILPDPRISLGKG